MMGSEVVTDQRLRFVMQGKEQHVGRLFNRQSLNTAVSSIKRKRCKR